MSVSPIGIDFGTSYSKLAFCNDQGAALSILDLSIPDRSDLFPSVIAFENGQMIKGWDALKVKRGTPRDSISFIKKLIGEGRTTDFSINSQQLSPAKSLEILFQYLKEKAEEHLKDQMTADAVLSLPSTFSPEQKSLFEQSAKAVGWNLRALIQDNEAVAASFFSKNLSEEGAFLFFHLGGSFLEAAVVIRENQRSQMMAQQGMLGIGGEDVDKWMTLALKKELEEQKRVFLSREDSLLAALWEESEKAKCALSHRGNYDVKVLDEGRGIQFVRAMSRYELAEIIKQKLEPAMELCNTVLKKAGIEKGGVKRLVISGGASRMPIIQEMLEKTLSVRPEPSVSLDHAVSLGAALKGWELTRS